LATKKGDKAPNVDKLLNSQALKKFVTDDTIYKGEEEINEGDVLPIKTRFPSLNLCVGIGGFPKGRIVEISGEEGSYKSALAWAIAGDVQRSGKIVAWIDAENAVDLRIPKVRDFLDLLEVDYASVIFVRPDTAEQAFQVIQVLAQNDEVGLIVFDSIVALSNIREEKADLTKEDRNTLPMTINRGLRRSAKFLRDSECTLLLINQLRQNMDRRGPYDRKWTTTGGKGLQHWCSLRFFAFKSKIKNSDREHIGNKVIYSVEKTRFSSPRDNAEMFYYFNKGFDTNEELFELCVKWGILEKKGNMYYYHKKKEQVKGRKKWIALIAKSEKLYSTFLQEVSECYNEYFDDNFEDDVDADMEEDDE
jgi:recombination protein RecA